MRARWLLIAAAVSTLGITWGAQSPEMPHAAEDTTSLVGTWRLVAADDRSTESGRWQHSYGDNPIGYLVYDETGHIFVQFCTNPPTPPFKAGDFKPTAKEGRDAYLNYVAYFGTYTVDAKRHVVTHHVEGSLIPSYTRTDQERPYSLHGDYLDLSDGKTWRRTWVRVRPPYTPERSSP